MEKRRKAKKRFSALTSFLLALALLTARWARCRQSALPPNLKRRRFTALTVSAWAAAPRWSCNTGIN